MARALSFKSLKNLVALLESPSIEGGATNFRLEPNQAAQILKLIPTPQVGEDGEIVAEGLDGVLNALRALAEKNIDLLGKNKLWLKLQGLLVMEQRGVREDVLRTVLTLVDLPLSDNTKTSAGKHLLVALYEVVSSPLERIACRATAAEAVNLLVARCPANCRLLQRSCSVPHMIKVLETATDYQTQSVMFEILYRCLLHALHKRVAQEVEDDLPPECRGMIAKIDGDEFEQGTRRFLNAFNTSLGIHRRIISLLRSDANLWVDFGSVELAVQSIAEGGVFCYTIVPYTDISHFRLDGSVLQLRRASNQADFVLPFPSDAGPRLSLLVERIKAVQHNADGIKTSIVSMTIPAFPPDDMDDGFDDDDKNDNAGSSNVRVHKQRDEGRKKDAKAKKAAFPVPVPNLSGSSNKQPPETPPRLVPPFAGASPGSPSIYVPPPPPPPPPPPSSSSSSSIVNNNNNSGMPPPSPLVQKLLELGSKLEQQAASEAQRIQDFWTSRNRELEQEMDNLASVQRAENQSRRKRMREASEIVGKQLQHVVQQVQVATQATQQAQQTLLGTIQMFVQTMKDINQEEEAMWEAQDKARHSRIKRLPPEP